MEGKALAKSVVLNTVCGPNPFHGTPPRSRKWWQSDGVATSIGGRGMVLALLVATPPLPNNQTNGELHTGPQTDPTHGISLARPHTTLAVRPEA